MLQSPVRRRTRLHKTATSSLALASEETAKPPLGPRPQLRVDYIPVNALREPNRKLRRYSKRHLTGLKTSISKFGMLRPVLADKDNILIAGVALWLVAKELGHETLPVIRVEHLTPELVRLYRIADNKLQMGEFDEDELRLEFLELYDLSIANNLDIDLEITGYTTKEQDDIMLRQPSGAGDGGGGSNGRRRISSRGPKFLSPATATYGLWAITIKSSVAIRSRP